MSMIARRLFLGAGAALLTVFLVGQTTHDALAQAKKETAKVEGFRSARFGMSERDVEKAIRKDFGLSGKKIVRKTDNLNQRPIMIIKVKDLLPDSGLSRVVYIFGYKSKKLAQVNVLFGQSVDQKADANAIVAAAQLLQGYFNNREWPPGKVILGKRMKDGGAAMFIGTDSKKRAVSLILRELKQTSEAEAAKRVVALQLSYVEKPSDPDVFQVEKGAF